MKGGLSGRTAQGKSSHTRAVTGIDEHSVTLYHNGLTCEADTLGSCGYVYIAIYPTQC